MEKTKLDHKTEDWLIAFLSGELDEREEENVRVWLEASPENRNALRIFDEGLFTNPVGTRKCTDTGRTGKKDHILFFEKEKESDALLRSGSFNSGVINCDIILFYSRG